MPSCNRDKSTAKLPLEMYTSPHLPANPFAPRFKQGTRKLKTYLVEMDRPVFKTGRNLCGQEKGEKHHLVDRPPGAVPAACSICVQDA